MAFDERRRLFVGMGPQYRSPKPDTPGDSVVLFLDTNGDGKAGTTKVFATGFNAIQGLAWHGRDFWIANAPDLTIVKDLDGDDEADEAHQMLLVPELLGAIKNESDSTVFYARWQALRRLSSTSELRGLLGDSHAAVRRAALLGLFPPCPICRNNSLRNKLLT